MVVAVPRERSGGTCPPTSHHNQLSNSSKCDGKCNGGGGVRELVQDFEMGVATRFRNNSRAWHPQDSSVCDGWHRPWTMGWLFSQGFNCLVVLPIFERANLMHFKLNNFIIFLVFCSLKMGRSCTIFANFEEIFRISQFFISSLSPFKIRWPDDSENRLTLFDVWPKR